jgi:hypothetical protein
MPFPTSLHGAVFSELDGEEATLDRLEKSLRSQMARSLMREGSELHFTGSFMNLRFSGSVLTVISRGRVRVSQPDGLIKVDYDLHFVQNILVRGACVAAGFAFILWRVRAADPLKTIVAGLMFWIALIGLDYLLAASMFPRFLQAQLKTRQTPDKL